MRKPIQITTTIIPPSSRGIEQQSTIIICDDGTIWNCISNDGHGFNNTKWTRLPDIPQDPPEPTQQGLNIR